MSADCPGLPLNLPEPSPFEVKRQYALESVRGLIEQQRRHGGVTTLSAAAKAIGVSVQRVGQFVDEGRIERVDLRDADGEVLYSGVSLASLRDYLRHRKEHRGGRPKKS